MELLAVKFTEFRSYIVVIKLQEYFTSLRCNLIVVLLKDMRTVRLPGGIQESLFSAKVGGGSPLVLYQESLLRRGDPTRVRTVDFTLLRRCVPWQGEWRLTTQVNGDGWKGYRGPLLQWGGGRLYVIVRVGARGYTGTNKSTTVTVRRETCGKPVNVPKRKRYYISLVDTRPTEDYVDSQYPIDRPVGTF